LILFLCLLLYGGGPFLWTALVVLVGMLVIQHFHFTEFAYQKQFYIKSYFKFLNFFVLLDFFQVLICD
jgi:hypothetical protein